jgi:hypothetical protein
MGLVKEMILHFIFLKNLVKATPYRVKKAIPCRVKKALSAQLVKRIKVRTVYLKKKVMKLKNQRDWKLNKSMNDFVEEMINIPKKITLKTI